MKNIFKYMIIAAVATTGFAACDSIDYPDRFKLTDGLPAVYSIRYADQDIYITSAYMSEVICLLGDNLTSVREMWFNDQKAILNTSYITGNTLIVAVPGDMPAVATDKIYLITRNADTVSVDFKVLAPVPVVSAMSNEWATEGEEVTITGNYFFDDEDTPIEIAFPGADVPYSDITINSSTSITCHVPEGAQAGYVTVTTVSGSSKSKFQYLDSRNILFDWDGSHGGFATAHGWRNGNVYSEAIDDIEPIDGSFLYFGGAELDGSVDTGSWQEDAYCFNYWPEDEGSDYPPLSSLETFADYIDTYGVSGLVLKFEACVPESHPWTALAMQLMFTSNNLVTYSTASNAYYYDDAFPRALWCPWYSEEDGSYDTGGGWVTVSVALSSFAYTVLGATCPTTFTSDYLTGLTFFVYKGAHDGVTCSPSFGIDNIRVVPNQ